LLDCNSLPKAIVGAAVATIGALRLAIAATALLPQRE
jgi:hypothetical protein